MSDHRLLAGAALLALCAAPTAYAQQADETLLADASDEIVVFGVGETRQQASITDQAIAIEAPGTSPLKAIERLPGVAFQSADAFGSYEWSARITLRGFNQNQLGFTLDGVPLGDMSYGNHNGLHVSRAAISENVARVDVAAGTGALNTASTSNLGGTVQFTQRRPGEEFGIDAALTGGDEETFRGYVRLDSGELFGPNSLRLSASYADQGADKWKGWGEQNQRQASLSGVLPVGRGEVYGFVNWSERRENDYQDMSLEMISRLGNDWDNISNDWALAVQVADVANNIDNFNNVTHAPGADGLSDITGQAPTNPGAGTTFPSPIASADDAYFNASGLRDDTIGAIRVDYPLTDSLTVSAMVYGHQDQGQGLWWTPYTPTDGTALAQDGSVIADPGPISVRVTEYDMDRRGFIGSATLDLGNHEIQGGVWLENNDFNQARDYYGTSRSLQGRNSLDFLSNPFHFDWNYDFSTETRVFYLQDTWTVTDALTLNAGFKSENVQSTAHAIVDNSGAPKNGEIEANDDFLPQAGFTYDVTPDHQIFGSYAENMRAFEASNTGGPFSASALGFAALQDDLKPETSRTYELGWRFRYGDLQGSVAAYDVEFENRLLVVALGAPIQGLGNGIQNVGSVESTGFEFAALWQLNDDWSLFGSYSHNESTYSDDVRDGTGALVAATAGKTVVNSPENVFHAELGYDNGSLFGTLAASYTGERFSSYLNDESVDPYTLFELTAGYRFNEESGFLNGTEVQLNVTNLSDEQYISTVGSGGFQNTAGRQTFLTGAPRQVFVTLRHHF